jgi:hypothetical protein
MPHTKDTTEVKCEAPALGLETEGGPPGRRKPTEDRSSGPILVRELADGLSRAGLETHIVMTPKVPRVFARRPLHGSVDHQLRPENLARAFCGLRGPWQLSSSYSPKECRSCIRAFQRSIARPGPREAEPPGGSPETRRGGPRAKRVGRRRLEWVCDKCGQVSQVVPFISTDTGEKMWPRIGDTNPCGLPTSLEVHCSGRCKCKPKRG